MLTFLSSLLAPTAIITHTTLRICLIPGKFRQKKKKKKKSSTGCNTWAPLLCLEIKTIARPAVMAHEDGKGVLQKASGERDLRIFSNCSGFQQRTPSGSKSCWQSLGSCSASSLGLKRKLQQTGRKPSSLYPTVFQHIVTPCKTTGGKIASTFKNTISDLKHFAAKAAQLPPGSSGKEATWNPAWA